MKKTTLLIAVTVPVMLAASAGGYYVYLTKKAREPVITYSDEGTVVTRKQAAVLPDNIDEVVVEDESVPEEHDVTQDMPEVTMPFAAEYFAGFLSEDEETVCRQLYSGLDAHEESIRIKRGVLTSDEICDMIVMCVTSSPEIDYLDPNYSVTVDGDGYVSEVDVVYTLDENDREARKDLRDRRLEAICSEADAGWSDYEKFKYIHDTLIFNCSYDESEADSYTAYGCLVKGSAVCEGYSKALMLACNKLGIECLPVVGQGIDDDGGTQGHIWNKVKLDGKWYNTDLTWDDPIFTSADNYVRYDFFAITDELSDKNHTADENKYFTLPSCDSTDDDYFVHNGYHIEYTTDIYTAMEKAVLDTMAEDGDLARVRCADAVTFDECVDRAFADGTGSEEVFEILKEGADAYPEGNYSYTGYSVINNANTGTVTLRLRRLSEADS